MKRMEKIIVLISIVLISLIAIGAVSAADADAVTDDPLAISDDVQTIDSDNEIDEIIQSPDAIEETQAIEEESPLTEDDASGDDTKTFTQLITDIGTESSEVTLTGTYKFDSEVDTAYPVIRRDLTINGPATIDGNGLTRLLAVTDHATLTLKNLNFINGAITGNCAGIYAINGSLDIQGCTFKNNVASGHIGAIQMSQIGSLIVKDTLFEGNKAGGQAAAITVPATATAFELINCTFIDNVAQGAVAIVDTSCANSKIIDSKFIGSSSANYGGALFLRAANSIVKNTIFEDNVAPNGGAIYIYNNAPNCEIDNCTFTRNNGTQGGSAIYVYDVDVAISNCIFDSNYVTSGPQYGYAGTVYLYKYYNEDMNAVFSKCIFVNNSAIRGSAIYSYGSNFVVENSIFLDNIATDEAFTTTVKATDICLSALFDHNTFEPSSNTVIIKNNWFGSTVDNYTASLQTLNETYGMWQGICNVRISNWYFLNLTATATPSYYDILISLNNLYNNDTEEVTQVTDCALPNYDVAVTATAGTVDPTQVTLENGIGHVTYALSPEQGPATITADATGHTVSKELEGYEPYKTFTQLIADIGTEASEVTLEGTYKFDPNYDTAYPVISRDLTINGPVTIDGNGLTRLLAVTSGTLTLKNITLINGYANASSIDGGAILASGGNLEIEGCTFKDNRAYRLAGAIRVNANSYLKVKDTLFESCESIGNQAGQGGAIAVAGTATGLEVENCTFIDCNTTNYGGAIDTALANSIINNCTFISNRASSIWGGALSIRGANSVVYNSVFKENTAAQGGSAIFILNVDANVTNCIFDSNVVPSGPQYGYQGTIYLYNNGNDEMNPIISSCIFVNNSALKGSAIASSSGFVVENSIFLDNIATDEAFNLGPQATDIFVQNPDLLTVIANNNWFGNTADNYTVSLQTFNETYWMWQGVANVQIGNWYFLNLTETDCSSYYDILISLNNLYDNATGEVTQVTDCALPDWNVTLTATAGTVTPSEVTLENGVANVRYALSPAIGPATITADATGPSVSKVLEGVAPHSLSLLQDFIDANTNGTFDLTYGFEYLEEFDIALKDSGIIVNKDIILNGNGFTIDGADVSRLFKVTNGATLTLNNIVLTDASATEGACVYVEDESKLIATSTTFKDSAATDGAGVYALGEAVLTDCTFTGNSAAHGSAIYNGGSVTLTNNVINDQYGIYVAENGKFNSEVIFTTNNNESFTGEAYDNFTIQTKVTDDNGNIIRTYDDAMRIYCIPGSPGRLAFNESTGFYEATFELLKSGRIHMSNVQNLFPYANRNNFTDNGAYVEVTPIQRTLELTYSNITCPDSLTISVKVYNGKTGVPINDRNVFIRINSSSHAIYLDSEGLGQITIDGLAVGDYVLNASISSNLDLGFSSTQQLYDLVVSHKKGTYTDFQTLIDAAEAGATINVPYDITYDADYDGASFLEGIIINKSITLVGAEEIEICGNDLARVFKVTENVVLTLQDLTVCDGAAEKGAGVYVDANSALCAINSTFTQNTAVKRGGAIYSEGAVALSDSVIDSNNITFRTANDDNGGAAIYNLNGILSIYNTNITNNLKDIVIRDGNAGDLLVGVLVTTGETYINNSYFANNTGSWGGAISSLGYMNEKPYTLTVENTEFEGNNATFGGAIFVESSNLKVTGCTFTENAGVGEGSPGTSQTQGGAIVVFPGEAYARITDSTFTRNSADTGGAVSLAGVGADSLIEGCTFTDNTADDGGAVYLWTSGDAVVTVKDSTFSGNAADWGNAISSDGKLSLSGNTISTSSADIGNYYGSIVSPVTVKILGNGTYGTGIVPAGLGETVTMNAVITDGNGNLIKDINYNFTVTNGDSISEVHAVYNATSRQYEAEFVIENVGDNLVSIASSANNNLIIYTGVYQVEKVKANLVINVANIREGEEAIVEVELTDKDGVGMADANIIVIVNGKDYNIVTGSDGKYSFNVPYLEKGQYEAVAVFPGNDNYLYAFDSTVFKVANPVMTVNIDSITYYEDAIIKVTVEDELTGTAIVTINDKDYEVAVVSGVGELPVSGLNAGDYVYNATFNDENGRFVTNASEQTFNVAKAQPTAVLIVGDVTYGDSNRVRVLLIGEQGENINATVELIISDVYYNDSVELVNGSFALDLPVMAAGTYMVTVNFVGNDNYLEDSYSISFEVAKASPVVAVTGSSVSYGEVSTVDVVVTDQAGNPIAGTVIVQVAWDADIAYDVVELDGDGKGQASFRLDQFAAGIGSFDVTVTYIESENYTSAVNNTEKVIVTESTLLELDVTVNQPTADDDVIITVTATDGMGTEIPVEKVNVTINGVTTEYPVDDNGQVNLGKLPVGSTEIEVIVDDGFHTPAGEDITVTVKPAVIVDTIVTVTSTNISYGGVAEINFALTDIEGNPIKGTLNVTVGDEVIEVNTTEDGFGMVTLENLNADTYPVVANYAGTDHYASSVGTGSFNVARLNTYFVFEEMTTTAFNYLIEGRVGDWFNFTLMDSNGKPLANMPVGIGNNGKIYNLTTDENGVARLQINLGKENWYTFAMSFAGDENYNAAFDIAKIIVNAQTAKLTVPNKSYKASAKTKTLTATFKSSRGTPIANRKITFTVNGKTYTAKTDSKGVAKVNVSITKKGSYKVTAKFETDRTYATITKTATLKIT